MKPKISELEEYCRLKMVDLNDRMTEIEASREDEGDQMPRVYSFMKGKRLAFLDIMDKLQQLIEALEEIESK